MHHDEPHDLGLAHDLDVLIKHQAARRRFAFGLAGAGTLGLLGCGGGGDAATPTTPTTTTASCCSVIPEETAGPPPTTAPTAANALDLSGIVRSDVRTSCAGETAVAGGVAAGYTAALTVGVAVRGGPAVWFRLLWRGGWFDVGWSMTTARSAT